mmetsp:Transcript_96542/g.191351  ORF Transcript_96542/g.191351 Transcript_96542/m.191351 type:complete len:261 (+) Transcript_96542:10-792(+)
MLSVETCPPAFLPRMGANTGIAVDCCVSRDQQEQSPRDFPHAQHLRCTMDYVLRCDGVKSALASSNQRSRSNSPARVPSFLQSTVCSESESIFKAATPRDDQELVAEMAGTSPNSSSRSATTLEPMTPTQGRLRGRGLTYEGELLNGMEHGRGVLCWDDGREYQGRFHTGRFHGAGVMMWPDGRRYEGEYQKDRKHGAGTFMWPEGVFYCGQWADGKKHGTGSFTDGKGATRRYRWIDDRPQLQGSPRHQEHISQSVASW